MSKLFRRSTSSVSVQQQGLGKGSSPDDDSSTSGTTERKVSKSLSMRFGPKRRASNGSTIGANEVVEGDGEARKGDKSKRRLSSIFKNSSSNARGGRESSVASLDDRSSLASVDNTSIVNGSKLPSHRPPPAPSSGLGTPTKMGTKTPVERRDVTSTLTSGGEGVSPTAVEAKLQTMTLAAGDSPTGLAPPIPAIDTSPLTAEPETIASPTSITASPTLMTEPSADSPEQSGSRELKTRNRSDSVYSQWSHDVDADDSDSDGEVYGTPAEGLSEVEEEDEDEDIPRPAHSRVASTAQAGPTPSIPAAAFAPPPPAYDRTVSAVSNNDLKRTTSSAVIERATVESKPDLKAGPRVQTHNPSAYTDLDQNAALQPDVQKCKQIIHLFLTSRMKEAEAFCQESDPDGVHMYIGNASAVIQAIKAMMTFDADDLKAALEIAKTTSTLSNSLRKPAGSITGRLAGFVRDRSGVNHVRSMTLVEKHAELVFAESLLIKAVLGIVAGGDWVGLIKEALNMRTAYGIYRTLQLYLETANDPTLDQHFKSGVQLGSGLSSLMLSLLPSKVMKVAELFGYAGDRKTALATLMAAGGWSADRKEPAISAEEDGVRRAICDMGILTFHLVISFLMPVAGVDVNLAQNVLDFNMDRFPDGIFFMYFHSRLLTLQAQPEKANEVLQKALMMKLEYLQLQHICLWDLGVNNLMLTKFKRSRGCFKILADESSWSKATYMYSEAACLAELSSSDEKFDEQEELRSIMLEVPKNMKRIAGKSLPVEKFVSRKARKFVSQGNRLMLPAIELGYFFGALPNTPPRILYNKVIPQIEHQLSKVLNSDEQNYEGGMGYWDDYCLAHFLLGTAYSFAAYPHEEAIISAGDEKTYTMTSEEASQKSSAALQAALDSSVKITLDHWIPYFTHYELARLCSQKSDQEQAKHHLGLILSGKPLETAPTGQNHGKYSLENALMLKAYAGMQTLKEDPNAKMH